MPHTPETSSSILDQISEIQDEAKKNKVKLTPEVTQYIREHLEAVQQKLANGVSVTDDDMKFMQDVRLWVGLPEEWREKYKNIEDMKQSSDVSEVFKEASERGISPKQWLDLLHIATANAEFVNRADYPEGGINEWINMIFRFPGGGRIETITGLNLKLCKSLKYLPENLTVNGDLELNGCTSLTSLPANLKPNKDLILSGCTSLTSLPDNLRVNGSLRLEGCTSLTSLPDNLRVNGFLNIIDCTSLTSLPADMKIVFGVLTSKNLNRQVIRDAERINKKIKK